MRKFAGFTVALFLAMPALAAAGENDAQLVPLYTQLISLLNQKILLLQEAKHPVLSILQPSKAAPSTAVFTVSDRTGTEVINFGDGHATGVNGGCVKNIFGWCDLYNSISHAYQTAGTYEVTLYTHIGGVQRTVSTTTITVTSPEP